MHFLAATIMSSLSFVASSLGSPTPSPLIGIINSPTSGASIAPNAVFPFSYGVNNWCEDGYNEFSVWLTPGPAAPTFADLTAEGTPQEYLFSFGSFLVANFGLPPMGTPPPATLTMPGLSQLTNMTLTDSNVFLSVVQTFTGCPGHIAEELGVISNPIVYDLTSST